MSERDEFEAWADERSITGGNRRIARLAWQAARATAKQVWQPIETAPKDGAKFLGYDATREEMYMIERVHIEYSNETTWCDRSGYYGISLTHWMPLPAAPQPSHEPEKPVYPQSYQD